MAQELQNVKSNKYTLKEKRLGFWYSIFTGYGISDKHITILVFLFIALMALMWNFFLITIISFYQISKLIGVAIALAFGVLMALKRKLPLCSDFWQSRIALILLVPVFLVLMLSINLFTTKKQVSVRYQYRISQNYQLYPQNESLDFENTFAHQSSFDFKTFLYEGKVNGKKELQVNYHQGWLGYWLIDSVFWVN